MSNPISRTIRTQRKYELSLSHAKRLAKLGIKKAEFIELMTACDNRLDPTNCFKIAEFFEEHENWRDEKALILSELRLTETHTRSYQSLLNITPQSKFEKIVGLGRTSNANNDRARKPLSVEKICNIGRLRKAIQLNIAKQAYEGRWSSDRIRFERDRNSSTSENDLEGYRKNRVAASLAQLVQRLAELTQFKGTELQLKVLAHELNDLSPSKSQIRKAAHFLLKYDPSL